MDFYTLAKSRYSVRSFQNTPVSQAEIDKILEIAHIAPTGCNYQPQRILVLNTEESLTKLKECTRCHFDAPLAMLVCYNKEESWVRPYDGALSAPVDASIVTTHMMLASWEMGVGSCWVMHFNPEKMRQAFAIPENIEPAALLVMGYPKEDCVPNPRHEEFRPMDETVVYGSF